jgi:uncharacterized membrane protein YgcG
MNKDAEQLQLALERAAHSDKVEHELASLVQTAQLASSLAALPPPPPNQLVAGRQRFLSEAARIRADKMVAPRVWAWKPATLGLAGTLAAVVLILGLIFGAGQAAADSLPGDPLYTLKLAIEASRMQLTTNREARADLATILLEERLDEITKIVGRGQSVDEPTANRVREQLVLALQAIHQLDGRAALRATQKLENTLRVQEQAITQAASTLPAAGQGPVQELLREINRVRQELQTGQGEPDGDQHRLGSGTPPEAPGAQSPAGQPGAGPQGHGVVGTPEPDERPGLGVGEQPEDKPSGPEPDIETGSGPGPWPGERPSRPQQPAGPKPGEAPGTGPGGQPDGSQPGGDSGSGSGSGGQPDGSQGSGDSGSGSGSGGQPDGSQPGGDPDSGSGSGGQPDGSQPGGDPDSGSGSGGQPGGSQPGGDAGSGSGSGGKPDGPHPGEDPGSGSEPQSTAEPQPTESPSTAGSQPPQGTDTDPGKSKP